jgi:hypothetical protein
MLQVFYKYIASFYSKCFIYFRYMLQLFSICCTGYTHVASICYKCFICFKQVFRVASAVSADHRRWCRQGRQGQAVTTNARGGAGCHRQCEEVQATRRRCGRGPHDSSAEYDAMEVIGARCFRTGIEPGARASHPGSVWQSHVHAQNNACTGGA